MIQLLRKSVLLKNFTWLAAGQLFYRIAYFVAIAMLARYVSVKDYGIISYLLIYVGMWAPLFNFGLGIIGVREIAQNRTTSERFISEILSLKVLAGIVACVMMIFSGLLLGYNDLELLFLSGFSLYAVLMSIAEFFHIPFTASEKMDMTAKLTIFERTSVSACAILFLIIGFNASGFVIGYVIGAIASVCIGYLGFKKYYSVKKYLFFKKEEVKFFIRESWPVSLNMFFALAYNRIGVVFLEQMSDIETVAHYNSAFFILFALQMGVSTLMQAIFPRLSKAHTIEGLNVANASIKIFKVIMPVILIGTLTLFYLSDRIVPLIFGQDYIKSIPVIKILIWVFPLFSISTYWANFFRSSGKQQTMAVITGIGMVVNVILSPIFIQLANAEGLAIAYVISEGLIVLLCFFTVIHQNKVKNKYQLIVYLGVFSLIVLGSMFYGNFSLNAVSYVAISILLISLVTIFFVKKNEIKTLKKLIKL